jgi:hypothetical protein
MHTLSKAVILVAWLCVAGPVLGQVLPPDLQGSWDVSANECRSPETSLTQIDIGADTIDTYGGDAAVREVSRSGSVSFVAADFLQREGAAESGERERVYFRLTQPDGRDRLNFVWKDVQTLDLVRCDGDAASTDDAATVQPDAVTSDDNGVLPIPTGLWVVAGEDCDNPANASWRAYDGYGLVGAQSATCEITNVVQDGRRYTVDQTCVATYDGSRSSVRSTVEIQAPRRFGLLEDGEALMQDFNWCSSKLAP